MRSSHVSWMATLLLAMLALCSATASAQLTVVADREMPDSYQPGVGFTVVINVTLSGTGEYMGVSDTVPLDWEVTASSPAAESMEGGAVSWVFQGGAVQSQVLEYTVVPPANAEGLQEFNGTVIVLGTEGNANEVIGGDHFITHQGSQPADYAVDGVRELPATFVPGQAFQCQVTTVLTGSAPDSYLIEEAIPLETQYVAGSAAPAAEYFTETHRLRWTFEGTAAVGRTVTYSILPDATLTHDIAVAGLVTARKAGGENIERAISGDALMTPSNLPDADVIVRRDLPDVYTPTVEVIYQLNLDIVGSGVRQVSISERIPAGWTASGAEPPWTTTAGDAFVWNFGPTPAPEDLIINVFVRPPADSTGVKAFIGATQFTVLEGTTPSIKTGTVVGDTTITDDDVQDQPGPITIQRHLPESYAPEQEVHAMLMIDVDDTAKPFFITIQETIPQGWALHSADPEQSTFMQSTGLITWNITPGGAISDTSIEYILIPPAGESGIKTFAGIHQYGTTGMPLNGTIEGDRNITSGGAPPEVEDILDGLLGQGTLPPGIDPNGDNIIDAADIEYLFSPGR